MGVFMSEEENLALLVSEIETIYECSKDIYNALIDGRDLNIEKIRKLISEIEYLKHKDYDYMIRLLENAMDQY